MSSLPIATKQRLKRIPQLPHVWEGNMFPAEEMMENLDTELVDTAQCILWIDASEGFVRSMEVVRKNTGFEPVVRSLLKAIEKPHSPAEPSRPQKVVVKDRQLQFFLRGALQDLDIVVDYQPNLPLLDEIWQNYRMFQQDSGINIPIQWLESLQKEAIDLIWEQDIWCLIAEYDIIEIEINSHGIESLYACVMGMMGKEFGVIFYRSLDSMKQFRNCAVDIDDELNQGELERSFLQQDCWFLNFSEDEDDTGFANAFDVFVHSKTSQVEALFGSIHPYEGIRPITEPEEIVPVYLAVRALGLFFQEFEKELEKNHIGFLSQDFQLQLPWHEEESFVVRVHTMPEVTAELEEIEVDDMDDDEEIESVIVRHDLLPKDLIFNFAVIPSLSLPIINNKQGGYVELLDEPDLTSNVLIPSVIIQSTRNKIKDIIARVVQEDGIDYLFFTSAQNNGQTVGLAVIETFKGEYYAICQFKMVDEFINALRRWQEKVEENDGFCGVAFAMGVTGAFRGDPQVKDILGFFETSLISAEDAGLTDLSAISD